MDTTKTCPFCAEHIPPTAIRCPFCRSELPHEPAPPEAIAIVSPPLAPDAPPHRPVALPRIPKKVAIGVVAGVAVIVGLVFALRPDQTPSAIEIAGLSAVITSYDASLATAKVRNAKGDSLSTPVSYALEPGGVAAVTPHGAVACLKRGDFALIASAGPASQRADVRCRPVAKVTGPTELTLALTSKPAKVAAAAFDNVGERYADVPIAFQSSDTAIFRVEGGRVVPVGLGSATLTASAGNQSAKIAVNVVDNVLFIPKFKIVDGTSKMFPVHPPGRYVVHVKVSGDEGGGTGVELMFSGSTCGKRDEARIHEVTCDFGEDGAVVVSNPAVLGLGPDLNVRLSLDREKT